MVRSPLSVVRDDDQLGAPDARERDSGLAGKRRRGIQSALPLLVGLYPFLVMFPLLVITGHPDLAAIMGWGVPWLLLGIGMATEKTASKQRPINHVVAGPARSAQR